MANRVFDVSNVAMGREKEVRGTIGNCNRNTTAAWTNENKGESSHTAQHHQTAPI
jgi:hypothetical protein